MVLIPKPGMINSMEVTTYRPICLTNIVGKAYEQLIKARIEKRIVGEGLLSGDAGAQVIQNITEIKDGWCAMITFNIKNAFNTAAWDLIIDRVEDKFGTRSEITEIIKSFSTGQDLKVR